MSRLRAAWAALRAPRGPWVVVEAFMPFGYRVRAHCRNEAAAQRLRIKMQFAAPDNDYRHMTFEQYQTWMMTWLQAEEPWLAFGRILQRGNVALTETGIIRLKDIADAADRPLTREWEIPVEPWFKGENVGGTRDNES